VPADAVRRIGVRNLEALRHGYADGGAVGRMPVVAGRGLAAPVTISPSITVTVEGGSRGPEADQAMGRAVAAEIENAVRGVVSDELRRAQRPGNLANRRG